MSFFSAKKFARAFAFAAGAVWMSGCGGDSGTNQAYTPADGTYTVQVNSAGNGASGGGSYSAGVTVTVYSGVHPSGAQFSGWTTASGGVNFVNANSMQTAFTMPNNAVTVTANFEGVAQTQTYTLTTSVSPTGGGSVSRNPNKTQYGAGEQVTVTATASSG
ncbi:MAG: hypothetical protein LBB74_05570, partial [Chitinispirillales bacterium]|nr:hypothetical protein [Chitinispirillales bacterium]